MAMRWNKAVAYVSLLSLLLLPTHSNSLYKRKVLHRRETKGEITEIIEKSFKNRDTQVSNDNPKNIPKKIPKNILENLPAINPKNILKIFPEKLPQAVVNRTDSLKNKSQK